MPVDIGHPDHIPQDHTVQFHRDDEEFQEAVGTYLAEALRTAGTAMVIATPEHVRLIESRLAVAGVDPEAAKAEGRLIVRDARETLAGFMVDGHPDPARFDATVGALCRRVAADGSVRAFGEMVALLWEEGRVAAVLELEELWNDLRRVTPFSLWCAYPATSMAAPGREDAVEEIRRCHSDVVGPNSGPLRATQPSLGPAPVTHPTPSRASRSFRCARESPTAARHFVTDLLEDRSLVDDVALVVTELATNAVLHARSDFSVTVTQQEDEVFISVKDGSPALPAPGEFAVLSPARRGLHLVNCLAHRWGSERLRDGKTVWAVLSATAPNS